MSKNKQKPQKKAKPNFPPRFNTKGITLKETVQSPTNEEEFYSVPIIKANSQKR